MSAEAKKSKRVWKTVLRSWFFFLVGIAVFQAIAVATPARTWEHANVWTAHAMAWAMTLLGATAQVSGRDVQCSVCSFTIIRECTGVYPMALYVVAVLSHPCGWRPKLIGVLAGVPLLILVNLVRLVSLCYIQRSHPESFESMHMMVWQSLIIFFTTLTWIGWGIVVVDRYERARA